MKLEPVQKEGRACGCDICRGKGGGKINRLVQSLSLSPEESLFINYQRTEGHLGT